MVQRNGRSQLLIGDWVSWWSKKKQRVMKGQIVQLYPHTAMIIWTTWDGRGHHWIEAYWKLKKLDFS